MVLEMTMLQPVQRVRSFLKSRHIAPAAGALLGACWFLSRFGWHALSVTNIDWLMDGDWSQHVLGFLHFRITHWGLPLGRIDTIAAPVGTNVGFTDSNPLFCLLLKPLSGILPADFQFIGFWLFLCFVLQGVVGAWLGERITRSKLGAVLASIFFITSPVPDNRTYHPTLVAHFLVLLALLLHFQGNQGAFLARRRLVVGAALVCVAAVVHPTIPVMVLALVLALVVQLAFRGSLSKVGALWRGAMLVVAVLAIWRSTGLIGGDELPGASGLGYFNADLAAFIHPFDYSRLIPRLPSDGGAYEGFAFLGLGTLCVGLLAPGLLASRLGRTWALVRSHLALVLLCFGLMFLAFSVQWRVFGHQVLDLESIAKPFRPALEPFRSSGRFIWPMHYLLIVAVLFASWRFLPLPRSVVAMAWLVAILVQVADAKHTPVNTHRLRADWYHLDTPVLERLARAKTNVELYPALVKSNGPGCDTPDWQGDILPQVVYLAYRLRLPINAGYLARSSPRHQRSCEEQTNRAKAGTLAKDTLYIVHRKRLADLANVPGISCEESGYDTFGCVLN